MHTNIASIHFMLFLQYVGKEEEKKKLQKRNADLEKEKATLQKNAQRYSESITVSK